MICLSLRFVQNDLRLARSTRQVGGRYGVADRFVEVQLYQAILESIASEHSARMVAMRNATDNAKDLTRDLTLSYNKTRQANITKEVSEIASGAAALAET